MARLKNIHTPEQHMLRYRLAGSRRTNRQLTYLHVMANVSVQQIAMQAKISENTAHRILMGQTPTEHQLRSLQRLTRKYSTQFKIATTYCDRSPEGEHWRTVFHHLYTLGQLLARDTKNADPS